MKSCCGNCYHSYLGFYPDSPIKCKQHGDEMIVTPWAYCDKYKYEYQSKKYRKENFELIFKKTNERKFGL